MNKGSRTISQYGEIVFTSSELERDRLVSLASIFDSTTIDCLRAIGVAPGWRCLEIGPGAGTMASWLAERVYPGDVIAADRDTTAFESPPRSNLTVTIADVTDGAAMARLGSFDLVYARFVLMHLNERRQALGNMIKSLRPGGWLLIEDLTDLPARSPLTTEGMAWLWNSLGRAIGTDADWGRALPDPLSEHGLVDTDVAVDVPVVRGAGPFARFLSTTFGSTLNQLENAEVSESVERFLRSLDDPEYIDWPLALVSAWGRRPT
ncbi:methyltransferase family protein [Prauserella shujinwangii]|uniref:Methyltransferase family protein n=2 Tax=Prauserella shujinwangii TaxID=1453103 RepID=A0A2T0M0H3_9PSEU|nr:methyltransferase family protein [Prauserella shujinwangii]